MKEIKIKTRDGEIVKVLVPDGTKDMLYMHTMEKLPALFDRGESIAFVGKTISLSDMCTSLNQIRKEQKKSRKWNEENMNQYSAVQNTEYGYIRILLK